MDIQEKWQSSVKTKGLGQFGITGETRKNLQEKCILSANENRTRTEAIREQLKPVKLEIEFAKYQERIKIRGILEEAFWAIDMKNIPIGHNEGGPYAA